MQNVLKLTRYIEIPKAPNADTTVVNLGRLRNNGMRASNQKAPTPPKIVPVSAANTGVLHSKPANRTVSDLRVTE